MALHLRALIAHHEQVGRPAATVAVTTCDLDIWDGDIALVDSKGAAGYLFKPRRRVASNLGSTGTWLVERALVQTIPPGFCDFSSTIFPALPCADLRLGIFDTGPVYLRDVGTRHGLLAANIEAITNADANPPSRTYPFVHPAAVIEDGAVLSGPVLVGARARVCSGAQRSSSPRCWCRQRPGDAGVGVAAGGLDVAGGDAGGFERVGHEVAHRPDGDPFGQAGCGVWPWVRASLKRVDPIRPRG